MTSRVQHIEKSSKVDLSPAVVVALNDTDALGERENSGEHNAEPHLDVANEVAKEASATEEQQLFEIGR